MIKISSESKNDIILIKQVVQLALEKKAQEVVSLDLRGLSSITDYYIICSGESEPQVKAIADNIIIRTFLHSKNVYNKINIIQKNPL